MPDPVPTEQQFLAGCERAFAFLRPRGFTSVRESEFCVLYKGPQFSVRVGGEGYGTIAAVELVPAGGAVVPLVLLIPSEDRSRAQRGQIAQINFFARQLASHTRDLLAGDMTRLREAQEEWTRSSGRGPAT